MASHDLLEALLVEEPPALQPVQSPEQEKQPTLVEGSFQSCEGHIERRSKILKRWKKEYIKVVPGNEVHQIVKHDKRLKVLRNFSTVDPNIQVQSLSNDPSSKDFLGFEIVNVTSGSKLFRFRTENIVECRKFMASLGDVGDGLFTKKSDTDGVPIEATHGLWDVIHPSEDELFERQHMFEKQERSDTGKTSSTSTDAPPTYMEAVQQLPIGFYFPSDTGITLSPEVNSQSKFSGQSIPLYDPGTVLPKAYRRPWHDNFKPPNGPPVFFPVSIGYGQEVGLELGLQALWDPNLRTYFFLDHIRRITFFEDPRPPPEQKPFVEKQSVTYGDQKRQPIGSLPVNVCRDPGVLVATTNRALSKPHGCVLYACGKNGKHGSSGQTGLTGHSGTTGSSGNRDGGDGRQGGDGGPGKPGTVGVHGSDGTEASDVNLNIWGDAFELNVDGTSRFATKLGGPKTEEVLFVNCHGGDGGNGGVGGAGGKGGRGGNGGDGGKGRQGHNSHSDRGENGGPGGNGGDGGNGGQGGQGGRGGDGGHAGNGGICVIQTSTPQLLMLVEADCSPGKKGIAGDGGNGGKGGEGGRGGSGGIGGQGGTGGSYNDRQGHKRRYPNGTKGSNGRSGRNGSSGPMGEAGSPGTDGNPASHGGILWVVSSPNGGVLYESATRYDVEVTNFNVISAIDDGIFEPNERISVSGCCVVNNGGLPLPSGAIAFMPSTKTIKFEPTQYELPSDQMFPNQSFVIPITYYGRIFDQPPPNVPGPFVSSAEFHPRVELLGRPFEKSFLHKKLVVQYPVKLAYLRCSENLGRGEVSSLEIGVQNISTMPYGDSPESGGRVFLQLHLDARLIPVGSANINTSSVPYTITYDPNLRDSLYIQLHDIPAGQTVNVQVNIQMESRAELFDRCLWQADLYLREKLIEYNFKKVRVTPFYTPQEPTADVLMITNDGISRKEFVFWQKILEVLQLSVDFWDAVHYNGISVDQATKTRHQTTWEGRYKGKLILYPHCKLDVLWANDIVRHFHGPGHQDGPLKDLHSSMILFLEDSPAKQRQGDQFHDRGDLVVLRHLAGAGFITDLPESYGGKHLFKPGTCFVSSQPYHKWEKKQLERMEKELPQQSATVYNRSVNIQGSNSFLGYSYGQVDIRRIPLLRSCKLVVYDGAGGNVASTMSYDDLNVTPTSVEIPLASSYAQVFLMIVYGIPIYSKLKLLKSEGQRSPKLNYFLPNRYQISMPELIMIALAWEIADEVYGNTTSESERMGEFAKAIEDDITLYTANGYTIACGLKLIQVEVNERRKKMKHAQVDHVIHNVNQHISRIFRRLQEVQVDMNNLRSLPSLQCLVDGSRVHYSHQHWVEDSRWNLPAL